MSKLLLTIYPNIEPVCFKMCGQIISSVRRDNLTTHFATLILTLILTMSIYSDYLGNPDSKTNQVDVGSISIRRRSE